MSISVKNITVAIDGNPSKGFTIDLDGCKWRMDNFVLQQELMSPCKLSFTLHKGPQENIKEVLFALCGEIIGKEVRLSLQTDNTESTSEIKKGGADVVGDIIYKGYITNASGCRDRTEYIVKVEAYTGDIFLINDAHCQSYENKTVKDIITEVTQYNDFLSLKLNPWYEDEIPYTVQYNENTYEFIRRLAMRFGEWLYNDGEDMVFGTLPEGETIKLKYPSQDIPQYNVSLQMQHTNMNHLVSSYNSNDWDLQDCVSRMNFFTSNDLHEKVFDASEQKAGLVTTQHILSGGWHDIDSKDLRLNISTGAMGMGRKSQMMTYSGRTYCSKIKIGNVLAIEDNFITSSQSNTKSNVSQDEILITKVTHYFSADETYMNQFEGIPSPCGNPPYSNTDVFPLAKSCRAKVKDTNDPNNLGRIRVQFDWQEKLDTEMWTPWLRIIHPYAGEGKGFSFIPEIGEEVMVDFEGGNAERPYVNGAIFNGIEIPDTNWLPNYLEDNPVKAIRTRNGHTIEIHDKDEGGYIKIYDHKKNNYVVTLSTDRQLIKLESSGNIELVAKNDIIMTAGNDITMSADHDINTKSTNNTDIRVDGDTYISCAHRISSWSDDTTNLTSLKDIEFVSQNGDGGIKLCAHDAICTFSNRAAVMTYGLTMMNTQKLDVKVQNDALFDANFYSINCKQIYNFAEYYDLNAESNARFASKGTLNIEGQLINID